MADVKLIAEAWDAAGLYQVGSFPSWGRWAEWNGRFRDEVRRFVKSDTGMARLLATRLAGSPDLYRGTDRAPWHSINFLTSHDGFTLADLVSYNDKHNWANGEGNTDGHSDNLSWNCGEEGPSVEPRGERAASAPAEELPHPPVPLPGRPDAPRRRRVRPHAARQQQRLLPGQRDLLGGLVAPRAERATSSASPSGSSVSARRTPRCGGGPSSRTRRSRRWPGTARGSESPTGPASRGRSPCTSSPRGDEPIYLIANAHWEARTFDLPKPPAGSRLAQVRGHEPAARRGRGRARRRAARRGESLRRRPPLGGGARGAVRWTRSTSRGDRGSRRCSRVLGHDLGQASREPSSLRALAVQH